MAESIPAEQSLTRPRHDIGRYIVLGIYVMCVLWGITQSLSSNGALGLLGSILFAVLTTGWCVVDSRSRGRPMLSIVQMIVFFSWPVAVPIYLVASRGGRGLAIAAVHAIAMLITMWIAAAATLYIAYGPAAFYEPGQ
jgi:hypothetical protein